MNDARGESITDAEAVARALDAWQQGDYTLAMKDFVVVEGWNGTDQDVVTDTFFGLAVITQTCDIVNTTPGKENVVVCPLVKLSESSAKDALKGRLPSFAPLECPPEPGVVVDLGRMMTVAKTVLAGLGRQTGFTTDGERTRFANALQRKHGRFAFPDKFSEDVLAKLRTRILGAHEKAGSDNGKAYRSIQTARATGFPNWDAAEVSVAFHFVLEPKERREADREQIVTTLDEHLEKIAWPAGFKPMTPLYRLVTLEEMTAAEWTQSQPIDWDFISVARAVLSPPSAKT